MSGTSVTKPQLELKRVKPALREFYQIYNTERLSNLDYIISSYIGKEVLLLEELKKRYNVDFEPFNILLDEYRAATAPTVNGVVDKTSEDSCDRSTVKSVASAVSVASLSPAPPAAQRLKLDSRNSINLGLSNIPTIEKLMSGWKGFTLEGVPDARKEDPTAAKVNEATTKLFEQLIVTPGLSMEVLQQLQESIEINARLERQLKSTLRKMEFGSSSTSQKPSAPLPATATKPRRGSSNDFTYSNTIQNSNTPSYLQPPDALEYGLEALSAFEGRSTESLSLEILGLRDIVSDMRDFIIQTLFAKVQAKEKPKEVADSVVVSNVTEQLLSPPVPASSSPPSTTSTSRMKESCEKLNIDWLDLERLRRDLTDISSELQLCKASLTTKETIIAQKNEEIVDLQDRLVGMETSIIELRRARGDLIQICEQKIKATEGTYREYLREMQENMQFEQEEAMSKLSSVAEIQQQWQAAISNEAQTEIIRLRVELAKSRRQESQREREVSYLQRQLMEASKQLAQFVVDSETADRVISD